MAGHSSTLPGLQALVDSCRARQPELVQQVESMMTELEHMSVLWTEQWHIALLELQVRALPLCIPALGLATNRPLLQLLDKLPFPQIAFSVLAASGCNACRDCMAAQTMGLHGGHYDMLLS